jgi:serralysin
MYGADFETRKADTTYTWTPSEGSLVIRENGIAVDVIDAPNTDTIFMTIWDGGGEDTFDFGLFSTELLIDLRPGEWIKTDVRGNSQTADLDGVRGSELADGNIANAYLYTDPTTNTVRYESLIENTIGGSKSDVFVANVEGNTFTGGGSGDVFRWMTLDDLLNRSPEGDDVIVDFARGDHIDFRYLDISTAPGLQSFSFHAQAKGTWSAGDLWYDQATDKLFGELNGDSYWDFGLDIGADYAMARSDLWLRPGDDLLA